MTDDEVIAVFTDGDLIIEIQLPGLGAPQRDRDKIPQHIRIIVIDRHGLPVRSSRLPWR